MFIIIHFFDKKVFSLYSFENWTHKKLTSAKNCQSLILTKLKLWIYWLDLLKKASLPGFKIFWLIGSFWSNYDFLFLPIHTGRYMQGSDFWKFEGSRRFSLDIFRVELSVDLVTFLSGRKKFSTRVVEYSTFDLWESKRF
jgi:hypothetical protein